MSSQRSEDSISSQCGDRSSGVECIISSRIGKKRVLISFPSLLNSETFSSLNPVPQYKCRWLTPTSQGWEENIKMLEKDLAQHRIQHQAMWIFFSFSFSLSFFKITFLSLTFSQCLFLHLGHFAVGLFIFCFGCASRSMWDLSSRTGLETMSPAVECRVLTTGPRGKSLLILLCF